MGLAKMKIRRRYIVGIALSLLILFTVRILSSKINQAAPQAEIEIGTFKIVNESYASIPIEGIYYAPLGNDHKQGEIRTSTAYFLKNYVYVEEGNKKTIGYYCPRNINSAKDNAIIQIELYTLGEACNAKIRCSGSAWNVVIDKNPRMYFLDISGTDEIGDFSVSVEDYSDTIVIKRLYIVDYDTTINKSMLATGTVVMPD